MSEKKHRVDAMFEIQNDVMEFWEMYRKEGDTAKRMAYMDLAIMNAGVLGSLCWMDIANTLRVWLYGSEPSVRLVPDQPEDD
jgi:hypothetical protein